MNASTSNPLTRALRMFTILTLVAARRPGRPVGREQLMEACHCCAKTIDRDLRLLNEGQIPISYDANERSYVLPDKGWSLTARTLTHTDSATLAVALALLGQAPEAVPLAEQISQTLDKVSLGLPPELRDRMRASVSLLHRSGSSARDYSRAPLLLLLNAARRQETVEILYDSRRSGTCENRRVDPCRLDDREGRYWEMQAWCHRDARVKTFALDRVLEARLTGDRFAPHTWDDSDVGVFGGLRGSEWIEADVHFDAIVAPYARDRIWPMPVTFEEGPEGSIRMRGRVRGVDGLVRELLSWRRHVVVLGGPELRRRMEEEVQAMAILYLAVEEMR